ncbi:DUF1345 domain-containing protein [Parafrigoribacterium mesophilum]|uniref:DUF1345 domain-containing protein n=1 Tax=Parafrigoribacterium mesophilum TaxID=433646 RepID=UPI0031FE3B23
MATDSGARSQRAGLRLAIMLVAGVAASIGVAPLTSWIIAPVVGWAVAALVYSGWVWLIIGRMDAEATASHATEEDPSRATTDLLIIGASLASLAAVAVILIAGHETSAAPQVLLATLAVVSVALSWLLVHTLFTLRYARLYYRGDVGGINFNQAQPPQYSDFAYLAFTLGMTFQVSDTNIETHAIRSTALRHALLSFVFGSVILATVINLVAGLSA